MTQRVDVYKYIKNTRPGGVLMKRYKLFVLILSLVLVFLPLNVNTATTSRTSLLAVEADEDIPTSSVPLASSPMGQNVELVTQIGGPVYAVDLAWPYAYIGMGPRVVILNISNPAQPVMVGQSDVLPGIIRNIAVAGDYVYATAEYAGLWIIRAADRAHPEIVGSITTNRPTNGVTVSGNLVYTVGADFQIVDVSDPESPRLRGSLDDAGRDIAVAGNFAYIVGGNYLNIINVADPDNPVRVGQYSLPSGAMASGVAVNGNYAYVATGNKGLRIIDISSPNNPVQAGALSLSNWLYDVAVAGRYAYLANTDALRIVDVSQPSNPTLIGACSLPWGSASAVALNGGYAYVGDQDGGLRIVRISSPSSPVETGHYDTVGYVIGVGWKDNYLYTTSLFAPRETGVRIYQVSDPSRPIQVGTYAARPGFTILIEGNRAYLGEDRLTILDVSNPASPTLIGQTETLTNPVTSVFVTDRYAYLVIYGDGMCIVDISNPSHPIRRGCYHYPGMNDVVVDGNYAYLGGFGFLYVLDVSDPDAPVYCGRYEPRDTINAVAVREKNLYALSDTYIRVLDLTTPCTPTLRSIYSGIGGRDILFAGDLAYVPANHKGVRILNVSDPLNIVEIGFYDTPGWTDRIAVAGDYIYAADHEGGLLVLRTTLPITAVIPVGGGSLFSPRDRTTLIFPPGAFTGTVVLTYTSRSPNDVPSLGNLVGVGHFFEITAVYSQTGQPAQLAPGKTFTMTVEYTESERGPAVEDTLALYWWNDSQWVREDSEVDPSRNMVIARPAHLSLWGVLGETRRVYLPITMRH